MEFSWEGIVKTVAPVLGTALGGPFGGMAAKAITGAILGEESDDVEAAQMAIANASPEQLQALKKAEYDFKAAMKELDIKEQQLYIDDIKDAREMQEKTDSFMPALIAVVAFVGFFGILGALIFVEVPDKSLSPLNIMLGSLGTIVVGVTHFYYGSSKGSKDKTKLMGK